MSKAALELEKTLAGKEPEKTEKKGHRGRKGDYVRIQDLTPEIVGGFKGNKEALSRAFSFFHGFDVPSDLTDDELYEDVRKVVSYDRNAAPILACTDTTVGCAALFPFADFSLPDTLPEAMSDLSLYTRKGYEEMFRKVFGTYPNIRVDDKDIRDVLRTYLIAASNRLAGLVEPSAPLLAQMEADAWRVILGAGGRRRKGGRRKERADRRQAAKIDQAVKERLIESFGTLQTALSCLILGEKESLNRPRWIKRWERWNKVAEKEMVRIARLPSQATPLPADAPVQSLADAPAAEPSIPVTDEDRKAINGENPVFAGKVDEKGHHPKKKAAKK